MQVTLLTQQTGVYAPRLGAGSARPNPKKGAPETENPLKHRVYSADHGVSRGIKWDKLNGTNFRRFLRIVAFPRNYSILEAQVFAGNYRFSQKTADFRRNPFVPFSLSLLVPP